MQTRSCTDDILLQSSRILAQVDAGTLSLVSTGTTEGGDFDFLSATFGATLPRGEVLLVNALPINACTPLQTPSVAANNAAATRSSFYLGVAVLVRRGGCAFGVKAKYVQVRITK